MRRAVYNRAMSPARVTLIALLAACSHPPPPQAVRASEPATAEPAPRTAFVLPEAGEPMDQTAGGPHRLVAYVPGGFVAMPKMLWDLAPAAPIPYPATTPQPARALDLAGSPELPIVLLVDRDVPLGKLAPLRDVLANRRWGFAVRSGSRYGILVPELVPPDPDRNESVRLSVELGADGRATLLLSRVHESHTIDRAQLEAALHEQKICAFFADHTDISIALPETATVGELVELLVLVDRVGFTSPTWLARDQLPR